MEISKWWHGFVLVDSKGIFALFEDSSFILRLLKAFDYEQGSENDLFPITIGEHGNLNNVKAYSPGGRPIFLIAL